MTDLGAEWDPSHSANGAPQSEPNSKKLDPNAISMFMDFFQPLPHQNEMVVDPAAAADADATKLPMNPVDLPDNWSVFSSLPCSDESLSTDATIDENIKIIKTRKSEEVYLNSIRKKNEAVNQSLDNTIMNTFKEEDIGLQSLSWYDLALRSPTILHCCYLSCILISSSFV